MLLAVLRSHRLEIAEVRYLGKVETSNGVHWSMILLVITVDTRKYMKDASP
jgi:hypothetical protein